MADSIYTHTRPIGKTKGCKNQLIKGILDAALVKRSQIIIQRKQRTKKMNHK